ncbi:hypothetical protein GCM10010399_64170 [Dactylosporangium fulvum]|uniref:DUF262 domain-containing protein n=1 Tax=Dactylosporangium fulvum TaxID=53359 RepID=A0ABY5W8R9_9ACTN|nr:DUF262 domain-containing protein [Dactylosporangium fulvum]UWP85760.1 DUF262 domain-containing protein [Dactylosporangium fulvum]
MTRQTPEPLKRLPINASSMPLTSLVQYVEAGRIDLNPPYQRGDVWIDDQRVALVYSWLTGATVPSITINDRSSEIWTDLDTFDISRTDVGIWAVIDGKQRLTTAVMWMRGEFAVPASWFPADCLVVTEGTADGLYVRYTGLTDRGQARSTDRTIIPVGMGEFADVRAEAQVYLLLNGGGTPQTDADMDNAHRIANP